MPVQHANRDVRRPHQVSFFYACALVRRTYSPCDQENRKPVWRRPIGPAPAPPPTHPPTHREGRVCAFCVRRAVLVGPSLAVAPSCPCCCRLARVALLCGCFLLRSPRQSPPVLTHTDAVCRPPCWRVLFAGNPRRVLRNSRVLAPTASWVLPARKKPRPRA